MSNLLEDQAIVFEAVKSGDWESQPMLALRTIKGEGRIQFLLKSLAALGLCDASGKLLPPPATMPSVTPDARLAAAVTKTPTKPAGSKPDADAAK